MDAEYHPRSRGIWKTPFPFPTKPFLTVHIFFPSQRVAQVWAGACPPSLPGAKVCRAETTFRQQCIEKWRSAPRSLQHFGAAENEVLFLREKPKSRWRQSSTAWLLSCQWMAAQDGHWVGTFVLGRWPGSVKSYCGLITYNGPGTVLRHLHASPYSNSQKIHKVGSNFILGIRKLML